MFFSNSAFEVWLLAHFESITRGLLSANELKRRLSNYLRGEYKKGDKAQLSAIVDHFEEAIVNTRNVSDLSYHTQCTNVGNLCQSIHGDL
ncbi:RloB domain-containing protein [Veillonella sp. VA139]|uniref:RloB domain-containing protein n=1 Tax=Veillonella sp. VA139 TaxID=741830 RepID=UPI000F8C9F39|nr:RloB domain-containing protein [Veillonella sp. VA139]